MAVVEDSLGGGGGGGGLPVDTATNRQARGLTSERLASWDRSNCRKVLDVDKAKLTGVADSVNFYKATKDSAYANLTQDAVVNNGSSTTLANTGQFGDFARTILGDTQVAVALYANFYSETKGQQQNTLLHELLHAIGWGHDNLVTSYRSSGLRGEFDISDWLERDCLPARKR
jgi:hypothetical protein